MVVLGCDHGGYEIKEEIKKHFDENKIEYRDFGTNGPDSVDYPKFAKSVAESVASNKGQVGILICGTGIGISIAANKVKGIRAALCHNSHYAELARKHNNANILCLGGRELDKNEAIDIVNMFLKTEFEGGRHEKRLAQITYLEDNN